MDFYTQLNDKNVFMTFLGSLEIAFGECAIPLFYRHEICHS